MTAENDILKCIERKYLMLTLSKLKVIYLFIFLSFLISSCKLHSVFQNSTPLSQKTISSGYEFTDGSSPDICFKETDIYLDEFDSSKEDSNLILSFSDLEVFSIMNQIDQVKIPCVGDINTSNPIEDGIPVKSIYPNSRKDQDKNTVNSYLKILSGFQRIALRGSPPKLFLKSKKSSQTWMAPIRPYSNVERFVTQQMNTFKDSRDESKERLFRYFKGQKAYHRPINSFGKILNPLPGERPEPRSIKFGQATVNSHFSNYDTKGVTSEWLEDKEIVGRPLAVVINDLKSGKLQPHDILVHVFKYQDKRSDIHWVTVNNRSLTVLRAANFEPENIELMSLDKLSNTSGPDNIISVLNRLVAMPSELPSVYSYIRVDGFNSSGEKKMAWAWDAPLGIRVGRK